MSIQFWLGLIALASMIPYAGHAFYRVGLQTGQFSSHSDDALRSGAVVSGAGSGARQEPGEELAHERVHELGEGPDGLWDGANGAALSAAIIAPSLLLAVTLWGEWHSGFTTALWLTAVSCLVVFAVICLLWREAVSLQPLIASYGVLLAATAVATSVLIEPTPQEEAINLGGWSFVHIVLAEATYGTLSVAAACGLALWIQERALKRRSPTPLAASFPSVAELDRLQIRLLIGTELLLALGVLTGMAAAWSHYGHLLTMDHKTILSFASFLVIAVLLLVHRFAGLRGRRAARFAILAYLLMGLAYPGVKFVTDVVL